MINKLIKNQIGLNIIAQLKHPNDAIPFMVPNNDVASVHELVHLLHAQLRNCEIKEKAFNYSFYYKDVPPEIVVHRLYVPVDTDIDYWKFWTTKGVIELKNPRILKNDIVNRIPLALRFSRFKTYILSQPEWSEDVLYLLDVWLAYCIELEAAITEIVTKPELLFAPLEFISYGIGMVRAVEYYSIIELSAIDDIKKFVEYMIDLSEIIYLKARQVLKYKPADDLYDMLFIDYSLLKEA